MAAYRAVDAIDVQKFGCEVHSATVHDIAPSRDGRFVFVTVEIGRAGAFGSEQTTRIGLEVDQAHKLSKDLATAVARCHGISD